MPTNYIYYYVSCVYIYFIKSVTCNCSLHIIIFLVNSRTCVSPIIILLCVKIFSIVSFMFIFFCDELTLNAFKLRSFGAFYFLLFFDSPPSYLTITSPPSLKREGAILFFNNTASGFFDGNNTFFCFFLYSY